jgi:cellulose biosynthesis protein BcsQ
MLKIDNNKKELIKKLNTNKSSDIYNILENEIKEAILNGIKMPTIVNMLEKELNKKLSINTLKKFVSDNKKRWLKEENEEKLLKNIKEQKINNQSIGEKKMENNKKTKKFILLANDKGGVGKTTLATLLDLPNSVILNLDKTREIADIYPFKRIIDFAKVKEEENINLEDFLDLLKEDDTFEYIIIDTKGGITEDLVKILPYIDGVIVPIKVGKTSEKPSYEFISQLKDYLDELNHKEVNWAIIYNEISPKFLKKIDFKFELVDEFKNLGDILKENLLGNNLKTITYFKRSEAITTREKEGQDITGLMKKNFGAYLVVKKEIERLNSELKKII